MKNTFTFKSNRKEVYLLETQLYNILKKNNMSYNSEISTVKKFLSNTIYLYLTVDGSWKQILDLNDILRKEFGKKFESEFDNNDNN